LDSIIKLQIEIILTVYLTLTNLMIKAGAEHVPCFSNIHLEKKNTAWTWRLK